MGSDNYQQELANISHESEKAVGKVSNQINKILRARGSDTAASASDQHFLKAPTQVAATTSNLRQIQDGCEAALPMLGDLNNKLSQEFSSKLGLGQGSSGWSEELVEEGV